MSSPTDKAMPADFLPDLRAVGPLRPFLVFLRQRAWLLLVWPAVALVVAGLLWGYVLRGLGHEERERGAELEQRAAAHAQNLVIRTRRSIAETDRLLLLLRHSWSSSGARGSLSGTMEAGIFSQQYIAAVAFIDRDGIVVSSTHPHAIGRYFGNRPYFVAQQNAHGDRLYLSGPLDGQLTGQEVVALSRPLLGPDGRFGGIVLINVLPAYFTQHYPEPVLGDYGFAAVARNDGAILATRTGETVHSYRRPFLHAPMPGAGAQGVALLGGRRWFDDGRLRVVGWRPFPDLGLVGIVGIDEYSAMASYRAHRDARLAAARWNSA